MYKLMIADDEPLIRRGIKQLIDLSSLQIGEIHEASTGEEALKVFEEFKPEIILMDINMPKIDGLSVAKKIKSINPDTKIAIITGYNYFDYAQTAIKIRVEDYILKPISKSDVSEIIVKLVNFLQKERKDKEIEKVLEKITTVDTQDNIVKNNYKELIQNIIEESYTDSQFTLSVLSEKLDLSSGYLSIMFKKNEKRENIITSFDKNMKKISSLDGLAPSEKIYSTRFMQGKAYMVTFKDVDPLFVIDIKDPGKMKVLGYLKIPGYSNYLHPYKTGYLIGFGHNTRQNQYGNTVNDGYKISLFDVRDFANPKEVDVLNIGAKGSYSYIDDDHKALMFDS